MSAEYRDQDDTLAPTDSAVTDSSTDALDEFDDLSVIDISSDVEYQLNQERTGVDVVKLKMNKSARALNGFDLFFVRFWAAIVAGISTISDSISRGFFKVFKKELPTRYVTSFISALLIILLIVIVLAPFNLTVGEKNTVDIFSNSLVPVARYVNGELRWGYANKSGREVIPCQFLEAEPFYHNVAFVKTDSTTWQLIGSNGKYKGDKITTDSAHPDRRVIDKNNFNNKDKRAWIIENGKYTFIKTNGKKAFGKVYFDEAGSFSDGYAVVRQGTAWYYINSKGKKKSTTYLEAKSYSEGLAAVKKDSGWTFVDTKFKEIIVGNYDAVTSFHEGYAWVRMGNTVNLIDKKGKAVLPTEYAGLHPSDEDLRELGMEIGR